MAKTRGQGRRKTRQRNRAEDEAAAQQKVYDDAYAKEMERQREIQIQEMEREVFSTKEGEGIMEGATVSLGFDEEEDEFNSFTGLMV